MSKYVNPFTDIGFKIIFGQPASKNLLITLLNELLAGEHHITELTFLDKEDHADNVSDKGIIMIFIAVQQVVSILSWRCRIVGTVIF